MVTGIRLDRATVHFCLRHEPYIPSHLPDFERIDKLGASLLDEYHVLEGLASEVRIAI